MSQKKWNDEAEKEVQHQSFDRLEATPFENFLEKLVTNLDLLR